MCFSLHGGGGETACSEEWKGMFCLAWKTGDVKGKMLKNTLLDSKWFITLVNFMKTFSSY